MTLGKPNGVFKYLKDQSDIGLDLHTKEKLAVVWIIPKCYYLVDLILNSIWIVLVFYYKFYAFRTIIFDIAIFLTSWINKLNIHNTIIGISSFQNGLNNLFSSAGFYFKSKVALFYHNSTWADTFFDSPWRTKHYMYF